MALTPKEAWLRAAEWGSYITSRDPGACMYGFNERGVVQSEEHRQACLDYIDTECRRAADVNIAAGEGEHDHEELDELRAYIASAPVGKAVG